MIVDGEMVDDEREYKNDKNNLINYFFLSIDYG